MPPAERPVGGAAPIEWDLSKTQACKRYSLRCEDLTREIEAGGITAKEIAGRDRLNSTILERELDQRRCKGGCGRITLSETGYCRRCVLGGQSTGRPKSPAEREKMSEAHRGKRLSPEHRANIGASLRRYDPDYRRCRCGNLFEVRRSNPDQGSCSKECAAEKRWEDHRGAYLEGARRGGEKKRKYERVERECLWCGKSLGLFSTADVEQGKGRFCNPSHRMKWRWRHRPEKLRRPRLGRVVTCACGETTRYLRPSRAHQRGCRRCRSARPEVRAHLAFLREQRAAEVEALKRRERLVDRREAALRLGRSGGALTRWAVARVLPPVYREVVGVESLFFRREDVDRVARRLARRPLRARRRIAFELLRPKRRGRKPSSEEFRGRILDAAAQVLDNHLGPRLEELSLTSLLIQAALRDSRDHRDAWSRYLDGKDELRPELEQAAADRLRKLVGAEVRNLLEYAKSLQNSRN